MQQDQLYITSKKIKVDEELAQDMEKEGFISLRPVKDKCEMCFINEFRYKCPGCMLKTCCLKCCNEHKVQKKCDGKYHQEKFIDRGLMDEKLIKKDLNYLNELITGSDNIKKKLSLLRKNQEQLRFKLLKIYARKFHDILVKLAPPIMSRHRENFSFYHTKTKKIFWTLELKFCSFMRRNLATGENELAIEEIRIMLDPQDETSSLIDIVKNAKIDDPKVLWYLQEKFEDTDLLYNVNCSRLYCYIVDEKNPRMKLARRIDWFVAFKDGIKDMTVIEYPSLRLVPFSEFEAFERLYAITDPVLVVTPEVNTK